MTGVVLPAGLLLLAAAFLQWKLMSEVTYPPVVFCFVWAAALVMLSAANRYLPLSNDTVVFLVAAAGMFCLGAAVAWVLPPPTRRAEYEMPESPAWLIPVLTAIVLVTTPFYIERIIAMVGPVSPATFLYALRVRTIDPNAVEGIGPIANTVPFTMICGMTCAALPPRTTLGRVSAVILFMVATILTVLTGSRAGPVAFVLSTGAIAALRRHLRPRHVVSIALATIALFAAMGLFLRKGTARPEASLGENIQALTWDFSDYTLGGIVAFNELGGDPRAIPDNGYYLRTVNEFLNHFGARTPVPSLHLQYSPIGDGLSTNVYTMYYAYFSRDGKLGALFFVMVCGFLSAVVHRAALRGSVVATLFYGPLAAAAALSVFNDAFFSNVNFLLKLGIFSVVLAAFLRRRAEVDVPDLLPLGVP